MLLFQECFAFKLRLTRRVFSSKLYLFTIDSLISMFSWDANTRIREDNKCVNSDHIKFSEPGCQKVHRLHVFKIHEPLWHLFKTLNKLFNIPL